MNKHLKIFETNSNNHYLKNFLMNMNFKDPDNLNSIIVEPINFRVPGGFMMLQGNKKIYDFSMQREVYPLKNGLVRIIGNQICSYNFINYINSFLQTYLIDFKLIEINDVENLFYENKILPTFKFDDKAVLSKYSPIVNN